MFTLAIGTVPSSNVPVQVLLPRRGIAAACPGALVRPLPRVLAVVGVQVHLLRPSIAAARPGALVRPPWCAAAGVCSYPLCRRGIAAAGPGARVAPKACPIILA